MRLLVSTDQASASKMDLRNANPGREARWACCAAIENLGAGQAVRVLEVRRSISGDFSRKARTAPRREKAPTRLNGEDHLHDQALRERAVMQAIAGRMRLSLLQQEVARALSCAAFL